MGAPLDSGSGAVGQGRKSGAGGSGPANAGRRELLEHGAFKRKRKVLIIGAGFAGITVWLRLRENFRMQIEMFSAPSGLVEYNFGFLCLQNQGNLRKNGNTKKSCDLFVVKIV